MKIIVLDQNDNAPEFNIQMIGSVEELSDEGTHIYLFIYFYVIIKHFYLDLDF